VYSSALQSSSDWPALIVWPAFCRSSCGRIFLVEDGDASDDRWAAAEVDFHGSSNSIQAHWIDGRGDLEDVSESEVALLPTGSETVDDFELEQDVLCMWNDQDRSNPQAWYKGKVVEKRRDGRLLVKWPPDNTGKTWSPTLFQPRELTCIGVPTRLSCVQIFCNLSCFSVAATHHKNGMCTREKSSNCLCHLYDAAVTAFDL
jgi:hypothetical protein